MFFGWSINFGNEGLDGSKQMSKSKTNKAFAAERKMPRPL
jgi:hypothetical protein